MMLNNTFVNDFGREYGVCEITQEIDNVSPFECENEMIKIKMTGAGFSKAIHKLQQSAVFELNRLDVSDTKPWIVKYDGKKNDVQTLETLAKKLEEGFPGQKMVFIPDAVNIEELKVEGITALRDYLNKVIEALDYDNIMGF